MFTWGSFWQEVGNVLVYATVISVAILVGFAIGMMLSKSRMQRWLRHHKDQRTRDLEAEVTKLKTEMASFKALATKQSVTLRSSKVMAQKVVELLS